MFVLAWAVSLAVFLLLSCTITQQYIYWTLYANSYKFNFTFDWKGHEFISQQDWLFSLLTCNTLLPFLVACPAHSTAEKNILEKHLKIKQRVDLIIFLCVKAYQVSMYMAPTVTDIKITEYFLMGPAGLWVFQ